MSNVTSISLRNMHKSPRSFIYEIGRDILIRERTGSVFNFSCAPKLYQRFLMKIHYDILKNYLVDDSVASQETMFIGMMVDRNNCMSLTVFLDPDIDAELPKYDGFYDDATDKYVVVSFQFLPIEIWEKDDFNYRMIHQHIDVNGSLIIRSSNCKLMPINDDAKLFFQMKAYIIKESSTQYTVTCPYCGKNHLHGKAGNGNVIAHCGLGSYEMVMRNDLEQSAA